ncbi:dihydrofolate reductase family protein [Streptomyces sp. A73]|uniref:dihydrofolate reductase family protein n=1 Tax=Streptomyces TaxID=1883 RepID=UPI001B36188C|nr:MULTISPECIES: dihydrofolate reductase family protein [unclassified Streptomyces]MBQ0868673.1 dihydrofolate reductase family protein [Streptomyces sp. RK75]MBQ1122727.1 dihydrofolate reductase family protein [Streptomyces sp. B15]MBQ1162907.1 dihydrofolate reductase family protein [Streptomyces sp. A73]
MKLILQEFLSLDGVAQGPGSPDEDISDGFTRGGWLVPHLDEEFMRITTSWLGEADAFLFGRRTYTNFARDWPTMDDPGDPAAAKLNGLPKYVASQSLTGVDWEPTTILTGDVLSQVAELKRQPGRELQIHGSARLGASLLAAGLIDELRLMVAPVVVGGGRRLFPDSGVPAGLRLLSNETTPSGVAAQVYEWTGVPRYGRYEAGAHS